MTKIALVEKYPSGYNFKSLLPFEFDSYSLTTKRIDKILKKDITLDMDALKEEYKFIILVGKDPCKLVADIRSVTEYQGFLVGDKYLAMLNPMAVKMKPSLKVPFEKSLTDIIKVIEGRANKAMSEFSVRGIETEDEALMYVSNLLNLAKAGSLPYLAVDSETSGFYPRNGYVLGISLSYGKEVGVYIESLVLTEKVLNILQEVLNITTAIFFNAKFDLKMLEYHLDLNFPNLEDAMLMHYCLDENSPHDLKSLCIKYTQLGDYNSELEEFKKKYCSDHGIKVGDFTYDLIPFNIMYPYASLDAAGTYELYLLFKPHIKKNKKIQRIYEELLKPGILFLKDVEENGMPINKTTLENAEEEINKEVEPLVAQLYNFPEIKILEKEQGKIFNVNSPKQLQTLLFTMMGVSCN